MSEADQSALSECPICYKSFATTVIEVHVDKCLNNDRQSEVTEPGPEESSHHTAQQAKRMRLDTEMSPGSPATVNGRLVDTSPALQAGGSTRPATAARNSSRAAPTRTLLDMFSPKRPELETRRDSSPPIASGSFSPSMSQPATAVSKFRQVPAAAATSAAPPADSNKPLAERLRPAELAQFVGQSHILGAKCMLRSVIEADMIPSMIFWGPPGCGKTSLANVIAVHCRKQHNSKFVVLSATSAGVNDVKEVVRNAKNDYNLLKRKTILFIDEIHRFNKLQQDTFLPHVENGTLTLIGATTENPSFSLNSALLSRCRVFVLEKLESADVQLILRRAAQRLDVTIVPDDVSDGDADGQSRVEESGIVALANLCDGDARTAINCFQLAAQSRQGALITLDCIKESLQRTHLLYDKKGDEHYNCISALHKSMRGGHGDGALYWLGRMLQGGEDPLYVARRLVRFASEDIGLADPLALNQAVATYQACHSIGMPECEVVLAQCVVYMTEAPKSIRVYQAYNKVKECIANHEGPLPGVPLHLRNAPTKLMKNLGYGRGYKYNPVYSEPVEQEYLPESLRGTRFLGPRPR